MRSLRRARPGLPPGAEPHPRGQSSRAILLVGLGFIAITIAIAGFAIWDLRQHTVASYEREISNLDTVLAEQTARQVNEIDLVLREVQQHSAALNLDSPDQFHSWLESEESSVFLHARLENMADVDSLIEIDAAGQLVSSTHRKLPSGIYVSDRDYFRSLATHPDTNLAISEPVTGRVSGFPLVLVARRVNGPDGRFLGVIAGAIDLRHLDAFYRAISTQPGQSITLLRRDGLVLARYPDPTHDAGTWMPSSAPWYGRVAAGGGLYRSPGYLGGLRALVSAHPVAGYPLVIGVSVKDDIALSLWWHQALMLTFAGAMASLGFALLSRKIVTLFRRQEQQNTVLRQTAESLRDSQARVAQESHVLQTTLEAMDQGLIMIGRDRKVAICNRRATELLDLPPELMARGPAWDDVLAHQWHANEFAGTTEEFQEFVRRSLLLEGPLIYDRERPNGRVLEVRTTPLQDGEAVRTYTDITERKRAEQRIAFLAYHDNLTGLANRTLLNDRLTQAVEYARRGDAQLAILSVDLDRFKVINDTYGHDVGDMALTEIGARLRQAVRAADTVARVGGDEFLILQTAVAQPTAAVELARRLIDVLSQPLELAGHDVVISNSIGIGFYPSDGDTAAALLKAADIALYRAKTDGRGVIRLFEPEMDRQLSERRLTERDLRRAIGTDRLALHFQPQFDCKTEVITGFEALLRWRHDSRGVILPGVFIPVAEESGLITELDAWVLESACVAAASWPVPLRVAVNLSAATFRNPDLPAGVAAVLGRAGLVAERLELEVTESLLIHHTDQALETMRALKQIGVRISLDDFGTGYSSLSYLRGFPFDKIKIDKSFVQALVVDPNALPIVQAILAMGRSLNLEVIAEGVETEQQMWILRGQHCSEVQGFLLGRPLPARDVYRCLANGGVDWPRDRSAAHAALA